MKFVKEKGLGNTIIILLSIIAFIVNIFMGGGNRFWIFLTGGGNLTDYGYAQYNPVFEDLQLWRLISCGYLHSGIFHLGFNIYALCCVGNAVEKRLGAIKYILVYHLLMAVTVAIGCMIFKEATTVGASSGIFAIIGLSIVGFRSSENEIWRQIPKEKRNYLLGYVIIGNLILPFTTAIHAVSFLLGAMCVLVKRKIRTWKK